MNKNNIHRIHWILSRLWRTRHLWRNKDSYAICLLGKGSIVKSPIYTSDSCTSWLDTRTDVFAVNSSVEQLRVKEFQWFIQHWHKVHISGTFLNTFGYNQFTAEEIFSEWQDKKICEDSTFSAIKRKTCFKDLKSFDKEHGLDVKKCKMNKGNNLFERFFKIGIKIDNWTFPYYNWWILQNKR